MVLSPFRFGEELGKGLAVRDEHFVAHARAEDVLCIMLRRHGDDGLLETRCVVKMVFELGTEPHGCLLLQPLADNGLKVGEGTAADKEDIAGIDVRILR